MRCYAAFYANRSVTVLIGALIMSSPSLKWIDQRQKICQIMITDRICIGRTCKGMAAQKRIRIEDPRVSRDHAEIVWTAGCLQIIDSSRNGTWVNQSRMSAGSARRLADGDRIRVGDFEFLVRLPAAEADDGENGPATELTKVASVSEVITALMADIRGFSAYAQQHSSAAAHGMIRTVFDVFSEIVDRFSGTLKDYAGDAIFAFWEHRFEDDAAQAAQACRAAQRQMNVFADLRVALAERYADADKLRIGWGLTTGPITLSSLGSRASDLAVVGDCVNLASRLSGLANREIPEAVVVCARTAALVEGRLALRDLGRHTIRGRQGAEPLFALGAVLK